MPPTTYPCLVCRANVTKQQKAGSIACCVCLRWVHANCIDVTPDVLAHFVNAQQMHGQHFWGCEGCLKGVHSLTMRINKVEVQLKAVERSVESNTEGVTANSAKLANIEDQLSATQKAQQQDKESLIKEATGAWSAELRDRESRKYNLLIYGLPEPPAAVTVPTRRRDLDYDALVTMFKDIGANVSKADIKFAVRPAKIHDNISTKPRSMIVGLKSADLKEEVFLKAKNLKHSRNFSRISIVPDLTTLQRNEDKALTEEAERRNEAMAEDERSNMEWRCIGRKGQRSLVKTRITSQTGGGAQRPPRPVPNRENSNLTGANSLPLGGRRPPRTPPGSPLLRQGSNHSLERVEEEEDEVGVIGEQVGVMGSEGVEEGVMMEGEVEGSTENSRKRAYSTSPNHGWPTPAATRTSKQDNNKKTRID